MPLRKGDTSQLLGRRLGYPRPRPYSYPSRGTRPSRLRERQHRLDDERLADSHVKPRLEKLTRYRYS